MHQRNLAGVTFAAEHAFAEERSADSNTVEPANELAIAPCLDAMNVAAVVQLSIEGDDVVVDPPWPWLSTLPRHR